MQITANRVLQIGAVSGLAAVILGAFGAHALKGILAPEIMKAYQTAVSYQFYHTLALLLAALLLKFSPGGRWLKQSAIFFLLGIILFCGSLYIMAFSGQRWLGAITPLGGVCFIVGWFFLWLHAFKELK